MTLSGGHLLMNNVLCIMMWVVVVSSSFLKDVLHNDWKNASYA